MTWFLIYTSDNTPSLKQELEQRNDLEIKGEWADAIINEIAYKIKQYRTYPFKLNALREFLPDPINESIS